VGTSVIKRRDWLRAIIGRTLACLSGGGGTAGSNEGNKFGQRGGSGKYQTKAKNEEDGGENAKRVWDDAVISMSVKNEIANRQAKGGVKRCWLGGGEKKAEEVPRGTPQPFRKEGVHNATRLGIWVRTRKRGETDLTPIGALR